MKKLLAYGLKNKEKLAVLTDQALVSGVNFVTSILLARVLGLESYGLFALIWMVVLFASSLHQAFIIKPLYTLYPKSENPKDYLKNLMGIQIGFAVLTYGLVWLVLTVAFQMYPEWNQAGFIWQVPALATLFVCNDYFRRLLFVLHRPFAVLCIDAIGYGLQPLLLLVLWQTDLLSISQALNTLIGTFFVAIVVAALFFYRSGYTLKSSQQTALQHWKFSRYLIGTALLQWVSGNLFILVGGSVLGAVAVGAIRIAQTIMGVMHVLLLAMENLIPIRAAEILAASGKIKMMDYFGKISRQAALPTLGLLGAIALFHEQIISALYGVQYLQYHTLLLAFCVLYILVFIGTILRFIIRTVENNRIIFWGYVVSTIFSFALSTPMVETWGIAGVMLGMFSVQVLTLGIYIYSLKSDLKWIFK